jgi:hypothetical protein
MDEESSRPAAWTISALAERCGAYCWVEHRLFQLTGQWAGTEDAPAARVHCSALSAQHAALAAQWADRLPVRAGVDVGALVVPPPGPLAEALTLLEHSPTMPTGLLGLVSSVLPRLLSSYAHHLAQAAPVSELPVMVILEAGVRETTLEIDLCRAVLQLGLNPPEETEIASHFCHQLERLFEGSRDIFPGARTS